MYYGYHRTSTKQQHLDRGLAEIESFCSRESLPLQKIFTDQQSGKNFQRERYIVLKEDILRPGDTLIISELDRLGRNKREIIQELQYFQEKNVRIMILEIPTTLQDFSSLDNEFSKLIMESINHILIEIYAVMAQNELEKNKKRQREGIECMKVRGKWESYGRPRATLPKDFPRILSDWNQGLIPTKEALQQSGLTRSTFYKYAKEYQKSHPLG